MREIKFRAWDKEKKEMIGWEVLQLNAVGFVNSLVGRGNWIPLQFTGLLDKNGKEIYEGDILRVIIIDTHTGKTFNGNNVEVEIPNIYQRGRYDFYVREVIGNIYENPNLLNKKDEK